MSLTPETTVWNPNRYKATEYVITYAADGTPSLTKKTADYTGVNYQFAALPSSTTTTTTDATTTSTTQAQTASAFGDVKPYYWQDEGGQDGANVFQWSGKDTAKRTLFDTAKDKFKRTFTPESYYTYKGDFEQDEGTIYPDITKGEDREGFIKRTTGFVTRPIKKGWERFKPLALRAIDFATRRSGANQSFRNIAGLYTSEITLMQTYGSTGATDMNPTGDPRKDDGGFNIVSGAGNYNKLGTGSRRHNMLKEADVYEKMSKEWKEKRNQIRADWKKEKETEVENTTYNIDSSGSTPDTGDRNGGQQDRGDAGKAGGEQYETTGSF